MSLEIERKFLVKGEAWRGLAVPVRIRQVYVATKDGTTVRVRVILRYKALAGAHSNLNYMRKFYLMSQESRRLDFLKKARRLAF